MRPFTSKYSLWCSTSSPAQRRRTIVIDSSKSFVWSLLVRPKSSNSGSKLPTPTPRMHPPVRDDVDHRGVLGHLDRVVERQEHDRRAEVDALRHGGERAEPDERRRHVAVVHHVVLGEEEAVEADLLGELPRLEDVLPAPRQVARVGRVLGAEQQAELHLSSSSSGSPRGLAPLMIYQPTVRCNGFQCAVRGYAPPRRDEQEDADATTGQGLRRHRIRQRHRPRDGDRDGTRGRQGRRLGPERRQAAPRRSRRSRTRAARPSTRTRT